MTDSKISLLPAAAALAGTEPFPIVQAGATKRSTPTAIVDFVKSETISQTITNGVTTKAPSENVVFDALALKGDIGQEIDGGVVT